MSGRPVAVLAAVVLSLLAPAGAEAAPITGVVFADVNGDGVLSAGESGVAGVMVVWEGRPGVLTNAEGRFTLEAPEAGIVWVRSPEGYRPAPTWREVGTAPETLELPLVPHEIPGPVTFVHASDTHFGMIEPGDARAALEAAVDAVPAPHFLTVTGDISNSSSQAEFDQFKAAVEGLGVDVVPVAGNHDWEDGGLTYRKNFGPSQYSFDAGGVHFIALNYMLPLAQQLSFLQWDLAGLPAGRTVAAFTHAPLTPEVSAAMVSAGVDYVFTGHYHANRVTAHGPLVEVNTQTLVMGSLDWTPAGSRLVTIVDGELDIVHHTTTSRPVLTLMSPRPGQCAPPGPLRLIAAAELAGSTPRVSLRLDGGEPIPLAPSGGWTHTTIVDRPAPGTHVFELQAIAGQQTLRSFSGTFCVDDQLVRAEVFEPWAQAGGSVRHENARPTPLSTPLATAWARPVGGHLLTGSPALAEGKLFVVVSDLGRGDAHQLLALDPRSGSTIWSHPLVAGVRQPPAVGHGLVVLADQDGRIQAVDASSGEEVWSRRFEEYGFLYAGAAIAGDAVYVTLAGTVAALALDTGDVRWVRTLGARSNQYPFHGIPTIVGPVGISALCDGIDAVVAWDTETGDELWRSGAQALGSQASPVVDGDSVYLVNLEGIARRADLGDGKPQWERHTVNGTFDWPLSVLATPAYSRGRLFVSVPQQGLVALDAGSGEVLWTATGGEGVVRPARYASHASGFLAPPVVTRELVWVGGLDGVLRALEVSSGTERWSLDLGAPILMGPIPSGNTLFVGTYDGTLRALAPPRPRQLPSASDGCATQAGRPADPAALLFVLALLAALRLVARARTRVG